MYATHRVKNSENETVGFMIDDEFYNNYMIKKLIKQNKIKNLNIVNIDGKIGYRAVNKLPVISYKKAVLMPLYNDIFIKNPIKRDIENDLKKWKSKLRKKVLRVDGARQIGKTTELKKFAYLNYDMVIYVNLAFDKFGFAKLIRNKNITPNLMKSYCDKAGLPNYLNSNKTILIIDEIQLSSEVYTQIREIKDNLNCDVVVTGSYLGKILNKDYFHPMGTILVLKMFPLSFAEFVNAFNERFTLKNISLLAKSDQIKYDKLTNLYKLYREIGGYPSVVSTYIDSKDINLCYEEIKNLLKIFKEESYAYFDNPRQVNIFNEVYRSILFRIASEKKGLDNGKDIIIDLVDFIHQNSKNIVSRDEINQSINWMISCGILNGCDLYLDANYTNVLSYRRIYFNDCGLFNYLSRLYGVELSNLNGLLTETFVFNELLRIYSNSVSMFIGENPAFSIYGNYELDFMIALQNHNIFGLEVKSSTGSHKSLDIYKSKGFIDKKVIAKLSPGGYDPSTKTLTIPIYTIGERFNDIINFNFV